MTQHQAPEVTSEDIALAEEIVSAADIVSHDGYYEVDFDRVAATIAAHRRATQPLSLTVDEGRLRDCLYELLDEHDPSCGHFDITHTAEKIAPLLLDRLQSLSGEQIAENANCSGASRFHFTDDSPFPVETIEGTILLGKGWLAITEDEYRQLNALPVDIDRSGLAQEVE